MPIDPDFAAIAADPRNTVRRPPNHVPLEKVRAAANAAMLDPTPPAGVTTTDSTAPGPEVDVPYRLYTPTAEEPADVIVFAHGGGFVLGNLETHDGLCRRLCIITGLSVAAVDYRLAPEAKYPAGEDDILAVTRHLVFTGARNLIFAGDSAGGYLALAACLRAQQEGLSPRHLVLFYPALDPRCASPSQSEFSEGPILTRDAMRWFWECHLSDAAEPYLPLEADLSALPPVTLFTAELDPLRDEGEQFARRLARRSEKHAFQRIPGTPHGFLTLNPASKLSQSCLANAAQRLAE